MTHTAMVWDDQKQTGELQGPGAHQPRPFMEGLGADAGAEVGNGPSLGS